MEIIKELRLKGCYWKKDLVKNRHKLIIAFILLIIASFLDYVSGSYTSDFKGPHVADVILDHVGPINLGFIFVWGYIMIIAVFFIYPILFKPNKIHLAVIMFSLLVFVRAIFVCLTHLTTPPTAVYTNFPWIFSYFRFQNDLFFSGHTSIPFLGFLIFKNKIIKYFMLVFSIVMAATVLLMHQHYSIDVFAAFFITYGVFKIGEKIFKEKLPA